eukprot:jgi/Botrbrau1/11979/Bobra.0115s0015.1
MAVRDLLTALLFSLASVHGSRQLKQSGCFLCDLISGGLGGWNPSSVMDPLPQVVGSLCEDAWDIIDSKDDLSIFREAVRVSGSRGMLRSQGISATVFAPTNAAMRQLFGVLNATQDQFLADPSLVPIVLYHIINANIPMAALNNGDSLTTMLGTNITVVVPRPAGGMEPAASPTALPVDGTQGALDDSTAVEPLPPVPQADPEAGVDVVKSETINEQMGVSAGIAPAPSPAVSILRKIFREEPRATAVAAQPMDPLDALQGGALNLTALASVPAAAPIVAQLQNSIDQLNGALKTLANATENMLQGLPLDVTQAFGLNTTGFGGSVAALNRTLAAGQLRIRSGKTVANVRVADIPACQGWVNIVDRVLFPEILNETAFANGTAVFILGDGSGSGEPFARFTLKPRDGNRKGQRKERGEGRGEGRGGEGRDGEGRDGEGRGEGRGGEGRGGEGRGGEGREGAGRGRGRMGEGPAGADAAPDGTVPLDRAYGQGWGRDSGAAAPDQATVGLEEAQSDAAAAAPGGLDENVLDPVGVDPFGDIAAPGPATSDLVPAPADAPDAGSVLGLAAGP